MYSIGVLSQSRGIDSTNIKKSYRQLNNIDSRNSIYAEKLPILDDDTQNIIEYVDQSKKKKKKFNFWNLLEKDE